ncbi:MAG TPA: hypothetical protein VGX23_29825 [Actinocrinis sp.]|nr:hypothetical protein [Actinocrinis sp.]
MSQPDRSTVPGARFSPTRRPKLPHRALPLLVAAAALSLTATACVPDASLSDSTNGHSTDPGCIAALSAVSEYGPRAVTDLAQGRVDVNKGIVHLLVLALDAAADTADQPGDKQAISTLASIYEQYYEFKTNLVAVPVSTLLKDTTSLDSACGN